MFCSVSRKVPLKEYASESTGNLFGTITGTGQVSNVNQSCPMKWPKPTYLQLVFEVASGSRVLNAMDSVNSK